MYILWIYFFILVVPIAVMPRFMRKGDKSPYNIVLYGAIGTAVMSVIVFMLASMSGQGVFAQINSMIEVMTKELAKNPMLTDMLGSGGLGEAERAEMLL